MATQKRTGHVAARPVRTAGVGIVLLLVGIALSVAVPATAQAPAGELNMTAEDATVSPDENVTMNVTVRNVGDRQVSQIDVYKSRWPSNWNISNATIRRLPVNASETVALNLSVPAYVGPDDYTLSLYAKSPEDVRAATTFTVTVPGPSTPTATATPAITETPEPPKPDCKYKIETFDWCIVADDDSILGFEIVDIPEE